MTLLKFRFGPVSLKSITVSLEHCLMFGFWSRIIFQYKSLVSWVSEHFYWLADGDGWGMKVLIQYHSWAVLITLCLCNGLVTVHKPDSHAGNAFSGCFHLLLEQLDLCRIIYGVLASFTLIPLSLLPRKDTWLAEKRENAMLGLLVLWTTWDR